MNIRQRLLLMFALVVVLIVGSVSWIVAIRARSAFLQVEQQRTAALVAQYRTEFQRQGQEVDADLQRLARADRVQRMTFDIARGGDPSPYVNEAASLAQEYRFDYLDFLSSDGTVISSAEWPAHFGYKIAIPESSTGTALHQVDLPNGARTALVAVNKIAVADASIYVLAGRAIDKSFLQNFVVAQGTYLWVYASTPNAELSAENLFGDASTGFDKLEPLIRAAQAGREISGAVQLSSDRLDNATVQTVPFRDDQNRPAVILLVGTSRRPLLELQEQIRTAALAIAGIGILLAIAASLWIAARFTRPIEHLAAASREVSAGHWDTHVDVDTEDELGELALSFNSMVDDLTKQRDRLVQVERVAAWRELARRLAHELKNPLFPLQLTVENLSKAKRLAPEEFDEIFRESTATLLAEISNLKTIIGRFSDFSKMPKPQLQRVDLNEAVNRVIALHQAHIAQLPHPVALQLHLATPAPIVSADPELLHRVIANLVLNAVDAMPTGGTIVLRTRDSSERGTIEVSDSGTGLTPEERERIFTPYYTTKSHGTGLGLAVAQSVISDHNGTITVESEPGRGTTFTIELPKSPAEATA